MQSDEHALSILRTLESRGFKGWIVGGAIRDMLLGNMPQDFDIATDAHPEEVLQIFPGSKAINSAFSVAVYVPNSNGGYTEVVTLRRERDYKDGRPQKYEYIGDLDTDLARRDATINAMAMDLAGNFADPFNGREDLIKKTIRAVGNPEARIKEHPIRMMRYIRLSTGLGFEIEGELARKIEALSKYILKEKWEAIAKELFKGLDYKFAAMYLLALERFGILKIILPEVAKLRDVQIRGDAKKTAWMHTLFAVTHSGGESPLVKFAVLLHDVGKLAKQQYDHKRGVTFTGHERVGAKRAEQVCRRFRLSAYEAQLVRDAIRWHEWPIVDDAAARKFVSRFNYGKDGMLRDRVRAALAVRAANLSALGKSQSVIAIESELVQRVFDEKQPFSVADLVVNGRDIMDVLEIGPGKEVGAALSRLMELVIEGKLANEVDALLEEVKNARETILAEGAR